MSQHSAAAALHAHDTVAIMLYISIILASLLVSILTVLSYVLVVVYQTSTRNKQTVVFLLPCTYELRQIAR